MTRVSFLKLLPLFVGCRDNEVSRIMSTQFSTLVVEHFYIVIFQEQTFTLLLHFVNHGVHKSGVVLNLRILIHKPWYTQFFVTFLHCLVCS